MPQKGKKTRAKTAPQAQDKTQTSETGAAAAAASPCIKENIWQLFATRRAGDTKLQYRPWPCTMVAMDGAMGLSPCRLPAIVQKPAAGSPSPSCLPQRHPATVQTRADLLAATSAGACLLAVDFITARCYASAVLAMALCLSVRLSVRH